MVASEDRWALRRGIMLDLSLLVAEEASFKKSIRTGTLNKHRYHVNLVTCKIISNQQSLNLLLVVRVNSYIKWSTKYNCGSRSTTTATMK